MIIYHCNCYDLNDHHHHLYLIIPIYFYYNYLSHDYYYLTASVIRKVPYLEVTTIYPCPLQSVLLYSPKVFYRKTYNYFIASSRSNTKGNFKKSLIPPNNILERFFLKIIMKSKNCGLKVQTFFVETELSGQWNSLGDMEEEASSDSISFYKQELPVFHRRTI